MKYKSINLNIATQLYRSLSEESRLRILSLIHNNGEMCGSDLELILDFTQTKTSRHLSYMKNAGFIKTQKHDQWIYYNIKEEFSGIINSLLSIIDKDALLENDQEIFKTMYANNSLAIRKLHNSQKRYTLPTL